MVGEVHERIAVVRHHLGLRDSTETTKYRSEHVLRHIGRDAVDVQHRVGHCGRIVWRGAVVRHRGVGGLHVHGGGLLRLLLGEANN